MHFQVIAFMWFYNLALKEKEEKFRNLGFREGFDWQWLCYP